MFNGHDLSGWRLQPAEAKNGWRVSDGELINETPKTDFSAYGQYGNLRTDAIFGDCQLHVEFKVASKCNSGIYVRGLYEAQVVDRDSPMQGINGPGAIFGRIEPARNAGLPGDQWQSYDITLVDRHLTVRLNGRTGDRQPASHRMHRRSSLRRCLARRSGLFAGRSHQRALSQSVDPTETAVIGALTRYSNWAGKKGSDTKSRNGPSGALHFWCRTPFSRSSRQSAQRGRCPRNHPEGIQDGSRRSAQRHRRVAVSTHPTTPKAVAALGQWVLVPIRSSGHVLFRAICDALRGRAVVIVCQPVVRSATTGYRL